MEGKAWSLDLIRAQTTLQDGELTISWRPGQNSALDHVQITKGRDVGTVTVQRNKNGTLADAVYDVTFAFVYHAFTPGGVIITE